MKFSEEEKVDQLESTTDNEKEETQPLSTEECAANPAEVDADDGAAKNNFIIIPAPATDSESKFKLRTIGLIGDLDEDRASEIMYGMLSLQKTGTKQTLKHPEDPESEELITVLEPFEMIVSTHGGSASDMFGIYDLMRKLKNDGFEIQTYGLGKVMSAGVLLLAAGTRGERKIGANCRVMIHAVAGGSSGAIHNLENEMDEIRHTQEMYINKLVEETAMSKKYLSNLLKKKVNVYLSAQEAVDLGIADEVV